MFRSTSRGRVWRPILGLALGVVLGATFLAPVAAALPTSLANSGTAAVTVYTRSASCAGVDFVPNSSSMFSASNGTERCGGGGYFICNPGLPNGAQVTKVQFTVRDDLPNAQISGCEFVSSDLRAAYATTYYVHASVPDTGLAATPGIVRLTASFVTFPIIDNTRNGYWLQCGSLETADIGIGIYGADVFYQISATKG